MRARDSVRIECECGVTTPVNMLTMRGKKSAGLPQPCNRCGGDLFKTRKPSKRGKTDSQKRSKRQEKRAAQRVGGYTTAGSGSGNEKGDVRAAGDTRIECKLTRRASFTLKLADLEKLEQEAAADEDPVFEIEFQGVYPHKRYAVIPGWLLDHYRETNRAQDSNTDD